MYVFVIVFQNSKTSKEIKCGKDTGVNTQSSDSQMDLTISTPFKSVRRLRR